MQTDKQDLISAHPNLSVIEDLFVRTYNDLNNIWKHCTPFIVPIIQEK